MVWYYRKKRELMVHASVNVTRPCIHAHMFGFEHAHMHTSFCIFFWHASFSPSLRVLRIEYLGIKLHNMEIQ